VSSPRAVDLKSAGEFPITLGTATAFRLMVASYRVDYGACVALVDFLQKLVETKLETNPLKGWSRRILSEL